METTGGSLFGVAEGQGMEFQYLNNVIEKKRSMILEIK